jgi:hypothetical protein
MNRDANYAIKRVTNKIPERERARDTMSSLFPFNMRINSEGNIGNKTIMTINFNKPPPDDCSAECIATVCEDFNLPAGGYLLSTTNPYEPGSVRAYSQGQTLQQAQWEEENPSAGQVYVQVQGEIEMIVVCYTYISC